MSRSALLFPSPFDVIPYSVSTLGDNIIVPGIVNKSVRVWRMKMKIGGAVNITIKDTDGNVYDGPLPFQAGSEGWVLDMTTIDSPAWYETAPGTGFVISLDAAVVCGGNVECIVS